MHTYAHTNIQTNIHPSIHTYIHTHIHTYIHIYIHTHIHLSIHTYIHTYAHTHVHKYIHAYIHTKIHTCKHSNVHEQSKPYINARKYSSRSHSHCPRRPAVCWGQCSCVWRRRHIPRRALFWKFELYWRGSGDRFIHIHICTHSNTHMQIPIHACMRTCDHARTHA